MLAYKNCTVVWESSLISDSTTRISVLQDSYIHVFVNDYARSMEVHVIIHAVFSYLCCVFVFMLFKSSLAMMLLSFLGYTRNKVVTLRSNITWVSIGLCLVSAYLKIILDSPVHLQGFKVYRIWGDFPWLMSCST